MAQQYQMPLAAVFAFPAAAAAAAAAPLLSLVPARPATPPPPPAQPTHHPVYILSIKARRHHRRAHWALWIPYNLPSGDKSGKLIHVSRRSDEGPYRLEFVREFVPLEHVRFKVRETMIGSIRAEHLVRQQGGGGGVGRRPTRTPGDELERFAAATPVPKVEEGCSLFDFEGGEGNQEWMHSYVSLLVQVGILSPVMESPLQNVPTHF